MFDVHKVVRGSTYPAIFAWCGRNYYSRYKLRQFGNSMYYETSKIHYLSDDLIIIGMFGLNGYMLTLTTVNKYINVFSFNYKLLVVIILLIFFF